MGYEVPDIFYIFRRSWPRKEEPLRSLGRKELLLSQKWDTYAPHKRNGTTTFAHCKDHTQSVQNIHALAYLQPHNTTMGFMAVFTFQLDNAKR